MNLDKIKDWTDKERLEVIAALAKKGMNRPLLRAGQLAQTILIVAIWPAYHLEVNRGRIASDVSEDEP